MADNKSVVTWLYNTVKAEFRARIFYGNEDSALDILTSICENAIGLVSETNLKFCFSVYVDTWTKIHVKDAQPAQIKAVLPEKYSAIPSEITGKTIDKSLEIIFSHEEKLAERFASPEKPPADAVICPNCGEKLPAGAKFCGKCRTKIAESDRLPKTVEPQPAHEQPLPSPKTAARSESAAPQRGVALAANSGQKFPLRLFIIVSSALVIITVGIILALVLANGNGAAVPDTASFMATAEKFLLDMNYEQAVLEFNKILEIDPMNVDAYLGKADALIAMGKTDEARDLLEIAYTKTGNPEIFDKLQSLIQPPASSSSEGIDPGNSEPIEIEPPEPAELVYQDPMCLAIEKTLTDYLKGAPITDTTNFDKVTELNIIGNSVFVRCGNRIGTGRVSVHENFGDDNTYVCNVYSDNSKNYVEQIKNPGSLADISFLNNMPKLNKLGIYNEPHLRNISILSDKTEITYLSLDCCGIKDISPLANLVNLKRLDMERNSISDISVLINLVKLTSLDMSNNEISDISVLANLTNLSNLSMAHNKIFDLSALSKLTKLKHLSLFSNNISDISVISNLTNLDFLQLGFNNISDITPVSKLYKLTYLELYQNNISNISVLSELTNLENLNLGSNHISDVTPLYNLKKLESLDLILNDASKEEVKKLANALGLEIIYTQRHYY